MRAGLQDTSNLLPAAVQAGAENIEKAVNLFDVFIKRSGNGWVRLTEFIGQYGLNFSALLNDNVVKGTEYFLAVLDAFRRFIKFPLVGVLERFTKRLDVCRELFSALINDTVSPVELIQGLFSFRRHTWR